MAEKELTEYDYFKKELLERLHDVSKASQLAFEDKTKPEGERAWWQGYKWASEQTIEWIEDWKP
jgi:hypothetical protein